MPEEILRVIIQLPVVAAFIWYTLRMQANFQAYLSERNARLEKALETVGTEMRLLRESFSSKRQ